MKTLADKQIKSLVDTGAYTIEEANAHMAITLHAMGAHDQAAEYEPVAESEPSDLIQHVADDEAAANCGCGGACEACKTHAEWLASISDEQRAEFASIIESGIYRASAKYDTVKLADLGYGDVTRDGATIELTPAEVQKLAEAVGGTVEEIESARI